MVKLRALNRDDEPAMVAYLNDKEVLRFLSSNIPRPYQADDARWFVEQGSKEGAFVRAIEYDGQFCGVTGAYFQPEEYALSAELGYWIGKVHWGKGLATSAVKAFTQLIFRDTDIIRLYNPVTAANQASIRVMEKAGYEREGVLRQAVVHDGQLCDEHLYARLARGICSQSNAVARG